MMVTTRSTYRLALGGALLSLATACATEDVASVDPEYQGGVVTQWTDSTELFMEHPALIVGADGVFAVHLTRVSDFAALATGPVTFRFTPRDGGTPLVVVQESPRAPGIFGPRPVFERPGTYDLQIEIGSPELRDTLMVPGLPVYADTAAAPVVEEEADDGSIAFLKEQAWKTPGFLTAFTVTGVVDEVREVPAVLLPTTHGTAKITAPIAGIVQAGGGGLPVVGQRVSQDTELAMLTPLLGEGGNPLAQARAELRGAEAEHQRASRLVAAEAAPRRRLEEAAIRLEAAREALSTFGGNTTPDGRIAIRSPIAGAVSEMLMLPGARVEAGTSLTTVIATDRLWLEVRIPATMVSQATPRDNIAFRVGEADQRAGSLVAVSPTIDATTRTVTARWSVDNRGNGLQVGALAVAMVPIGVADSGIVIPRSAILDDDGQAIAFVQISGESFERRVLTLGASGVDLVVVQSGLNVGERIVTGAANQVRLASLSSAVPVHGHEH